MFDIVKNCISYNNVSFPLRFETTIKGSCIIEFDNYINTKINNSNIFTFNTNEFLEVVNKKMTSLIEIFLLKF